VSVYDRFQGCVVDSKVMRIPNMYGNVHMRVHRSADAGSSWLVDFSVDATVLRIKDQLKPGSIGAVVQYNDVYLVQQLLLALGRRGLLTPSLFHSVPDDITHDFLRFSGLQDILYSNNIHKIRTVLHTVGPSILYSESYSELVEYNDCFISLSGGNILHWLVLKCSLEATKLVLKELSFYSPLLIKQDTCYKTHIKNKNSNNNNKKKIGLLSKLLQSKARVYEKDFDDSQVLCIVPESIRECSPIEFAMLMDKKDIYQALIKYL